MWNLEIKRSIITKLKITHLIAKTSKVKALNISFSQQKKRALQWSHEYSQPVALKYPLKQIMWKICTLGWASNTWTRSCHCEDIHPDNKCRLDATSAECTSNKEHELRFSYITKTTLVNLKSLGSKSSEESINEYLSITTKNN